MTVSHLIDILEELPQDARVEFHLPDVNEDGNKVMTYPLFDKVEAVITGRMIQSEDLHVIPYGLEKPDISKVVNIVLR